MWRIGPGPLPGSHLEPLWENLVEGFHVEVVGTQRARKDNTMERETFEAFEGQQDVFGYSQAVRVGDTIYVAGTLGIGEGLVIPESVEDQISLAYRNIAETL